VRGAIDAGRGAQTLVIGKGGARRAAALEGKGAGKGKGKGALTSHGFFSDEGELDTLPGVSMIDSPFVRRQFERGQNGVMVGIGPLPPPPRLPNTTSGELLPPPPPSVGAATTLIPLQSENRRLQSATSRRGVSTDSIAEAGAEDNKLVSSRQAASRRRAVFNPLSINEKAESETAESVSQKAETAKSIVMLIPPPSSGAQPPLLPSAADAVLGAKLPQPPPPLPPPPPLLETSVTSASPLSPLFSASPILSSVTNLPAQIPLLSATPIAAPSTGDISSVMEASASLSTAPTSSRARVLAPPPPPDDDEM